MIEVDPRVVIAGRQRDVTSQRCTTHTHTHTIDCNHTMCIYTETHAEVQHIVLVSPELSQHYWSWCCVSEVIAGSMAAAAGSGPFPRRC